MSHLERGITYAVAGLTSTGKTRLVEHTTRNLRDQGYDAVCFSVGDMFRHLIRHVQPPYDSSAMLIGSVHDALKQTDVVVDSAGRVRLVYNGEVVRQTYENGNLSARISTNGQIIYHVDEYIQTHITGPLAHHDFRGIDGRERRDAQIVFRTTAPRQVRVAVRRIDEPQTTATLSDETIKNDILGRDHLEFPLLRGLFEEDVNVVTVDRTQANGESDSRISKAMAGILVDFALGKMESNFGTVSLGTPKSTPV